MDVLPPFDGSTVEVTNYAVGIGTDDVDQLGLSNEHTALRFVSRTALHELDVKDPSIFATLGG